MESLAAWLFVDCLKRVEESLEQAANIMKYREGLQKGIRT